jgi:hypothetical protein
MAAGDLTQRAVLLKDVDRAPVGQQRDRELSDLPERLLVVQRSREQCRGLVEEGQRLLGAQDALFVVDRLAQ